MVRTKYGDIVDDENAHHTRSIFDVAQAAELAMKQAQYERQLRARQSKRRRKKQRKSGRYPSTMAMLPGQDGFNQYATELMQKAQVLAEGDDVRCPGAEPYDQPYQRSVAYLVHPQSAPDYRMLVAHRTGSGKTRTMIRVLSNFFDDSRPKVAIFPEDEVALNFYKELMSVDNPYRTYVLEKHPRLHAKAHFTDDDFETIIKTLALHGQPGAAGKPGFLAAPLRAFSYRQIGGQALQSMSWFRPHGGCPTTSRGTNMWCDKVVVMDEAHNLIKPSEDKFKNPRSVENLRYAREALAKAIRTVLVLFTATPMVDSLDDVDALLAIVKGAGNERLSDDGFVSAFYGAPRSAYAEVTPDERDMPLMISVELGGDPDSKTSALGAYLDKALDASGKSKLTLSKRNVYEYTPVYPSHQTRGQFLADLSTSAAKEMVPKLWRAAEYIEAAEGKVIVLTAKNHGFFALDSLLRTNPRFRGLATMSLLGKGIKSERADWRRSVQARRGMTEEDIKAEFNSARNVNGELIKALVLNADAFSEGVNFKDVRHVVLLDVTPKWATVLQRVGRAVRQCSHVRLPPAKRHVRTVLMVATLPAYVRRGRKLLDLRSVLTADEEYVLSALHDRQLIEQKMCGLMRNAVDGPLLGPSAGSSSCGSLGVAPRLPKRLTAQDRRDLDRCAKAQHRCMQRAHQHFDGAYPDPERFEQAMALCLADRDDCVEEVLGPPGQEYGLNCPPTFEFGQCVRYCRDDLGLSRRDLGRCIARKHTGVLDGAEPAADPAAMCPSCPDGVSDCAQHCADLGLVHGDLYRCAARAPARTCEHPVGPPPTPPPPPPPPEGMVYNPLTERYIKRGSARHRQLCETGQMPPEDCELPERIAHATQRERRGAAPSDRVYNPATQRYIKRGSARHRELCDDGLLPPEDCVVAPPNQSAGKPRRPSGKRPSSKPRRSSGKPRRSSGKPRRSSGKPTVPQLRAHCKAQGIRGYSKWKRDELLARCGQP